MAQPVSLLQPSLTLAEYIDSEGVFPEFGGDAVGPFIGEIDISAAQPDTFGFLAEGQTLPSNITLFDILSTNFGGNGAQNFELPDLSGDEMIGSGQGPGVLDYFTGFTTGPSTQTIQTANLPVSLGGKGQPIQDNQSSTAVTYCINAYGVYPSGSLSSGTIGVVTAFAGTFAPGGELACDGQLLSIANYEALYALIGTTYGGDGVTTFALPDLRGRDIVGAGNGYTLGQDVGNPTISLTKANLPSEGSAPINVTQPGLVLNYYIATAGLFPSDPVDQGSPQQGVPFLGQIFAFAGTLSQPTGCMLCDGQLLSIQKYPALFTLLGTTYGGDGITTFALPNLEGRSILGVGASNPEGQVEGSATTQLTDANFTPPTIGSLTATTNDAVQDGAGVTALASVPIKLSAPMTNGFLQSLVVSIADAQPGDVLGVNGDFALSTSPTEFTTSGYGDFAATYSGNALTIQAVSGGLDTDGPWETVMSLVGFQDNDADISTGAHPTRTLDWIVDDGIQNSAKVTTAIVIDRAPVLSPETVTLALPIGGETTSTSAQDVLSSALASDSDGDTLTVVAVNGAAAGVGAAVAGADGTLTLNADGSFSYRLTGLSSPTDSFTYTVSDGAGGTATQTLTFDAPTAVAPTISAGASAKDTLGGSPAALDSFIALTAPDTGGKLESATVEVSGGTLADGDTLAATTTGTNIVARYDPGSETLSLAGLDTIADYEKALDSVTFAAGTLGARIVDWTVDDGVLASAPATSGVAVDAVAGTAAFISSIFDSLNANPVRTTITDGQPLHLSVTQALIDTAALNAITNTSYAIEISDSAFDVAPELAALAADARVKSIVFTDANPPTLTLTVSQALEGAPALREIVSLHSVVVSDLAANIQTLTQTEIAVLGADGVRQIVATDADVNLSGSQKIALGAAGITLQQPLASGTVQTLAFYASGAPSEVGDFGLKGEPYTSVETLYGANGAPTSKTVLDGAALYQQETWNPDGSFDILTYVPGTFDGVSYAAYDNAYTASGFRDLETFYDADGVTSADVVASETFQPNGGFAITLNGATSLAKTVNPDGSFDIRVYTAGTFDGMPYASYDSAYDASDFCDQVTFYAADNQVLAQESFQPGGAYDIRVYAAGTFEGFSYASYDNAFTASDFRDQKTFYDAGGDLLAAESFQTNGDLDIRIYAAGTFDGVAYASFDNAFTSSNVRYQETYYDSSNDVVASETFQTNGGYAITLNGVQTQVETVDADGTYDVEHLALTGLPYSSYENVYDKANTWLVLAKDNLSGPSALTLLGSDLTAAQGAGALSVEVGSDAFNLDPHYAETITATGQSGESFDFTTGFGQTSIAGFLAGGATHDVLNLQLSSFESAWFVGDATAAQEAASLLSHAASVNSTVFEDSAGDVLTLLGVTKATLAGNLGDIRLS